MILYCREYYIRSSVNFGGKDIFAQKYMYNEYMYVYILTKCPNFTWYLPEKYFSGIFQDGAAGKIRQKYFSGILPAPVSYAEYDHYIHIFLKKFPDTEYPLDYIGIYDVSHKCVRLSLL